MPFLQWFESIRLAVWARIKPHYQSVAQMMGGNGRPPPPPPGVKVLALALLLALAPAACATVDAPRVTASTSNVTDVLADGTVAGWPVQIGVRLDHVSRVLTVCLVAVHGLPYCEAAPLPPPASTP